MTVGTPQPAAESSWWSRNWMWVVPVGCLTPIVLLALLVTAIALFVFGLIRSTDVYKDALARAQAHPEVARRLGSPIEPKWWLLGSINVENDEGEADFVVPIRGPKGDGTIEVEATKDGGKWTYTSLVVNTPQGEVDLLSQQPVAEESSGSDPPTDK
jgi:hypothetical protein